MLFLILAIVVALVAWALRLMDQALKAQEFSLMLAGFLVASSAAALVGVYFLMSKYILASLLQVLWHYRVLIIICNPLWTVLKLLQLGWCIRIRPAC